MNNFYIVLEEIKKLKINKKKKNVIFKYNDRLMIILENNLFIEINTILNDTYLFEDKKYYDFNKLIFENILEKTDFSLPSRKLIIDNFLNKENYKLIQNINFDTKKFIEDINLKNNDNIKVYKNEKEKLIMLDYDFLKIYKNNLVY